MYIIVTTNKQLAEEAKKQGANVAEFKDTNVELVGDMKRAIDNEECVVNLLHSLCIKPNWRGYKYLKYIFERCMITKGYHNLPVTKVIYPECAKKFDSTVVRVERALRHAICASYAEWPITYEDVFEVRLNKAPTVSEFIAMGGEYLLENNM